MDIEIGADDVPLCGGGSTAQQCSRGIDRILSQWLCRMSRCRRASDVLQRARENAETLGFQFSSDTGTGSLLVVLAASVPLGGRILELGTGVGVGTAALVAGLAKRRDIELITIELDERRFEVAQSNEWPPFVTFLPGDLIELLPKLGQFDLIFADALQADYIAGGKWVGLERTVEALGPRALLLMDDMAPKSWWTADHAVNKMSVRTFLGNRPDLVVCDITSSSGLLLCAKRGNA